MSITGENKHYGTPTNPSIATQMPGGSSSGAVVAVLAELMDFSLSIDTDGGVRVPAAFCGILRFCPSHGVVSTVGVVPMTQSVDTIGWSARDSNILCHVGHVLLQLPLSDFRQRRSILVADDCFQLLRIPEEKTLGLVISSVENLQGQVLNHINLG